MISIRRILCPIDFSPSSRRALDHALAIASWYGARVTLFHVQATVPVVIYAPATPIFPPPTLPDEGRGAVRERIKALAETAAGSSIPIDIAVAEGDAAAEILAKAEAMSADLLILGTHGRSGLERFLLGSVTEKVLRKAGCPVLSIPAHVTGAVPAAPPIFNRIVCAVDFSGSSMRALEYAAALAQEADAHLTVVHVIGIVPDLPPMLQPVTDRRKRPETVEQATKERQMALEAAVPEHVRAYCTIETMVTGGIPYEEVLRVAAEQHGDLIVLGARRRNAANLIVFGSTAQQVVRRASCPVLTLGD